MVDPGRQHYLDAVENYKRVRQFIEHENILTNYRQTWHATIQAGLFLAFFEVLKKSTDIDRDGGTTYAYYWIFMVLIGLLGMAVSLVIASALNSANISVSRLETWWYRTYEGEVSVGQDEDPSKGALSAHPPINGIFTGGVQTGYEPRMIPHFVLWCWVFLLLATLPWKLLVSVVPRPEWYVSVSGAFLLLLIVLKILGYYGEHFVTIKKNRCLFKPR